MLGEKYKEQERYKRRWNHVKRDTIPRVKGLKEKELSELR